MFAAMFGRNDILKLLLDNGANRSILDVRGLSVRDLAAQQGNEAALSLLSNLSFDQ